MCSIYRPRRADLPWFQCCQLWPWSGWLVGQPALGKCVRGSWSQRSRTWQTRKAKQNHNTCSWSKTTAASCVYRVLHWIWDYEPKLIHMRTSSQYKKKCLEQISFELSQFSVSFTVTHFIRHNSSGTKNSNINDCLLLITITFVNQYLSMMPF